MSTQKNSPWDEARLLQMIKDGVEESATLEYKAAGALQRAKKEEITKDVSAFANAAGGTIIYGLAAFSNAHEHLPEKIDPIDRTQFSKEWLEQIIGQIQPRIPNVHVEPVPLKSAQNHVAYVVEIPEAETAHQALTMKYHRRYNFEVLPMSDREIRDVMNRRKHPKVTATARLIIYPRANRGGAHGRLIFTLQNDSDVLARYVALVVHTPVKIKNHFVHYFVDNSIMDDTKDGRGYKLNFSNHDDAPLFPRTTLAIGFNFALTDNLEVRGESEFLDRYQYCLFADSMPASRGSFTTEEIYEQLPVEPWVDVKQ